MFELNALPDDFELNALYDTERTYSAAFIFYAYLTDELGNYLTDELGNRLIAPFVETLNPQVLHSLPDDFKLNAL